MTSGRLETITLIVIAVLLIAGVVLSARPRAVDAGLSGLKVRSGDTLWTLAAAHPVEGLSTAEVADLIAEVNGRESAMLRPGETIMVPSGSADTRTASR